MTPFITCEHAQKTPEWFADRCGRLNGSDASKIFMKGKGGGESVTRTKLKVKIAMEQLNGKPQPSDFGGNSDTDRGNEYEPLARLAMENLTGLDVRESGYVYRPDVMAGCSVDGFIDDKDGLAIVEIKCPNTTILLDYFKAGVMPSDYQAQIDHNMWVTGAKRCYFGAFNANMIDGLDLFMVVVEQDAARKAAHDAAVLQFLMEVDKEKADLKALAAEQIAKRVRQLETETI